MGTQRSNGSTSDPSPVPLRANLEKSLSAYSHAAMAAAVGLLALAPPTEARIVYTHTHKTILLNGGPVPLDLNHDAVADFSFSYRLFTCGDCSSGPLLAYVTPGNQSNAVWGRGTFSSRAGFAGEFAAALHRGFAVGPNKAYFQKGKNGLLCWADNYFASIGTQTFGQWFQTKRRYLGLQFLIDRQIHYGWARLQVPADEPDIILTGYAYETIPNKPIVTGQTKGAEIVDEPQQRISQTTRPATLGMLALGFPRYRFGRQEMKRNLAPSASQH